MSFLEATRTLSAFGGGPALRIRLAASGNLEPLVLYLRAAAAKRGYAAEVSTLPFGTLGQSLVTRPSADQHEVFLLLPWDLAPECDWRSGIPITTSPVETILESAREIASVLKSRNAVSLYLPAAVPPVSLDPTATRSLAVGLTELAAGTGATFLDDAWFALGSYLTTGVPLTGAGMGAISEIAMQVLGLPERAPAKVLVTDLDEVLWAGLVAEEGVAGVECGPAGKGYRHFLYQSLLAKLKSSGVLLAAVSRNDLDIARGPIASGKTLLKESDFVEILASYDPKSSHIRRLAANMNVGLDAFVFVDDNPIELAEVMSALPEVSCIRFPPNVEQLPQFLSEVALRFPRHTITAEDRDRTEMYRRRLETMPAAAGASPGSDLTSFLATLKMRLTIHDRSSRDGERALQLINKTNQFNLNGRRVSDEQAAAVLAGGGRLFTASLDDRAGSHGEILACLIEESGKVLSFVLSCRVFQRFVEHAFVCWLVNNVSGPIRFEFAATERNTPLREFLAQPAFISDGGVVALDGARFLADHASRVRLFQLVAVDAE